MTMPWKEKYEEHKEQGVLEGSVLWANEDISYLSMDECENGCLYWIAARNASLGIYNSADKSFTISRLKFSSNFLFNELHWETGFPYGTVMPYEKLEKAPVFSDNEVKLRYLNEAALRYGIERKNLVAAIENKVASVLRHPIMYEDLLEKYPDLKESLEKTRQECGFSSTEDS